MTSNLQSSPILHARVHREHWKGHGHLTKPLLRLRWNFSELVRHDGPSRMIVIRTRRVPPRARGEFLRRQDFHYFSNCEGDRGVFLNFPEADHCERDEHRNLREHAEIQEPTEKQTTRALTRFPP